MLHAVRKALLPTLGLVVVVLLLQVLVAASRHAQESGTTEPTRPQTAPPPWQPLHRPGAEVERVAAVLEQGKRKNQLKVLEEIASSNSEHPLSRALAAFASGVLLVEQKRSQAALEQFRRLGIMETELAAYALYYIARETERQKPDEALGALEQLVAGYPDVAIYDEAQLRYGRLLASRGQREEAARQVGAVARRAEGETRGAALDELARILVDLGRREEAVPVLEELYYGMPTDPRARDAGRRLTRLRSRLPKPDEELYALAFERAELLLETGRYRDAYSGYQYLLRRFPKLVDRQLVALRQGVAQYKRRRLTNSRTLLKKVTRDDLRAEALFYQGEAARRPGEYQQRMAELLDTSPPSRWVEAGLLSLGHYHRDREEEDIAIRYFRQLVQQSPRGEHALEAQWIVLWERYRKGSFREAAEGFERAARERPEAFEISRFLYWAGRASVDAGDSDKAESLYRQVLLGYKNTYYGRRAYERILQIEGHERSLVSLEMARQGIDFGEALRVRRERRQRRIALLLAVGLPEEALKEAQTAVTGDVDDASFLAIAAWIHAREDRNLQSMATMRQAFPFHISATGDLLPRPIWEVMYPLRYWDLVQKYSAERGLDPYLVAALIRQESTFNPRVRSRAGARGLMQIMPSTGKILARQERRKYQLRDLYNPEVNIRYGTLYLKLLLARFNGRVDYGLASYNAGPHRVRRWTDMDLTIDPEVFIEEIPFDETRNYVKLVLRNEMLYRRLYGQAALAAE